MKKKVHKLQLSRETLRQLEGIPGKVIVGGAFTEPETCGFTCRESCGQITRCTICCP